MLQRIYKKNKKKMVINPELIKKRQEEVERKEVIIDGEAIPLSRVFGLSRPFYNNVFDVDEIIGSEDVKGIAPAAYESINTAAETLLQTIAAGQVPAFSTLFYFGKHARLDVYAYQLLSRAYLAGLNIAPCITIHDWQGFLARKHNLELYLTADILVVIIPAGYTVNDLEAARGLLQARSLKDKPTIVLLGAFRYEKHIMLNLCSFDTNRLDLCNLIAVTYAKELQGTDITERLGKALEATNAVLNTNFDTSDQRFSGLNTMVKRESADGLPDDDFMKHFKELNSD